MKTCLEDNFVGLNDHPQSNIESQDHSLLRSQAKPIQQIRPLLHQLYPLLKIGRTIVCAPNLVLVLMREGGFNQLWIKASII